MQSLIKKLLLTREKSLGYLRVRQYSTVKKSQGRQPLSATLYKTLLPNESKESPENKFSFQTSTILFSHFTYYEKQIEKSKSNLTIVKFSLLILIAKQK